MSQPIRVTCQEAARISAQLEEYETISSRLREESAGLTLQHPHQWAGINSDQQLTIPACSAR